MIKKNLNTIIVFFILLIAACLYFYKLSSIPSGFYVDEASVAYNSYSILKTGRDEYGFSYPVHFRLMGSYTPSLFIYLSTFLMNFFDMTPFLFRSISAVSALISIYVFYLLVKKMNIYKLQITYFVITFFYAISPWLLFNARVGYETTLGFLIFNIGAYFLFLAYKKTKYLIPVVAFFSVSTYISHNQRFLAPLFLTVYLLIFRNKFFVRKNLANLKIAFMVGLVVNIPNLTLIGTKAFWIKSAQFNPNFVWNFLVYLSPKTLFFQSPDIDMQHVIPKTSLFYDWMVVPYFAGMYFLVKRIKKYEYKFLAVYAFVALLPAIFSSQFFSEQKVLVLIIPLAVILGGGIDEILGRVKPVTRLAIVSLVSIYSLVILYTSYFVLFPKEMANGWNYGYERVASFIRDNPDESFLLDDTRNPRAYILLLYFLKFSPSQYQKELGNYYKDNYYLAPPPADSYSFGNVEVRPIDWEKDSKANLIIVGDPLSISQSQAKEHNFLKAGEIKDSLGNIIFNFYSSNGAKRQL